jgi:hypothetical protein
MVVIFKKMTAMLYDMMRDITHMNNMCLCYLGDCDEKMISFIWKCVDKYVYGYFYLGRYDTL